MTRKTIKSVPLSALLSRLEGLPSNAEIYFGSGDLSFLDVQLRNSTRNLYSVDSLEEYETLDSESDE